MNAEQYLVLFILVIFFILSGPLLSIVNAFANAACNLAAGIDCLADGSRTRPSRALSSAASWVTRRRARAAGPRIFSGIQPTGAKHLGNLIGGVRQYVEGQERGESIYCLVDLHAITVPHDPDGAAAAGPRHRLDPDRGRARPGPMHPVPAERRRRARLPVLAAGQRHRVRRAEPDDAVQGEVCGPEGLRLRRPLLLPGAAGGGHPRVPDGRGARGRGPEAAHRACPNGRRALQLALRRSVHRPAGTGSRRSGRGSSTSRTRTRRCPRPAGRSRGRSTSSTRPR